MKRNIEHNIGGLSRLINRLMIDRKKAVFAICLVVLMLFMWIRVFTKKGPASAQAAPATTVTKGQQENSTPPIKLTFVELPEVSGRHDVVNRDFFDSHNWDEFITDNAGSSSIREVNMASGINTQEIRRASDKLKLESIWMGSDALAYINNTPLKVADTLLISEGSKTYEFEVVSIVEKEVVVRCEGVEVLLKLSQITGNSN